MTIHVLQGERERSQDNKSLGRFDLTDIPPAPRGVPQIEVTFDIDANGILNVSAKDKATGKSQNIVIKASSGLDESEIERMVADAESHAEEDKKFRDLIDVRNQADNLIHGSEKTLSELGEKVSSDERMKIENAISDLKGVMESEDKESIEAKTKILAETSAEIAQKLYAEQAAAGEQPTSGDDVADENVVDAEFEEVKEQDNNKD